MKLSKRLAAAGFAATLAVSSYFVVPDTVWAQSTIKIGALIHALTSLSMPFQSGDNLVVDRSGIGFKTPVGEVLQTRNNLSDIATTTNGAGGTFKTSARNNIAGAVTSYVSITDFASVDPTGIVSSDAAFVSCITSGKDCRIPAGTYLISCTNHNATLSGSTTPITIFGDDWHTSNLKVSSSCTLPTAGLIDLANVKDLTINLNNAIATTASPVLSNLNGTSAIATPVYSDVHLTNVGASSGATNSNIIGFKVGSTSAVNVTNPVLSKNFYTAAGASSTTVNQCILVTQTAGTVSGGLVDGNICTGSAIDASGSGMQLSNNDIGNFAYRAGIYTEIGTTSNTYVIQNNRIHGGGAVVVNGAPTDGIANYGGRSIISGNSCNTLGGVCVVNVGQSSTITGNNAYGMGKRNDGAGGAAYYSFYLDATNNGNKSIWTDNYGVDDGSGTTTVGFSDNANTAGLLLSNNHFPGLIPYELND